MESPAKNRILPPKIFSSYIYNSFLYIETGKIVSYFSPTADLVPQIIFRFVPLKYKNNVK